MKHGVVNFLKPPGMTSSDAVVALRRLFQEKRVGHTGTLDPGAAGVLPIRIGHILIGCRSLQPITDGRNIDGTRASNSHSSHILTYKIKVKKVFNKRYTLVRKTRIVPFFTDILFL